MRIQRRVTHYLGVVFYRRHLPHLYVVGQPVFITWRLHGSLPVNRWFTPEGVTSGHAFAAMDRLLDQARLGPMYLRQPSVADVVVSSLRYGDRVLGYYSLHSFVVMANHVHLLVTPKVALPLITKSIKGITARRSNALLSREGNVFWQQESYDHLVRSEPEFKRVLRYIEWNPVRVGLSATPEEFPWSSAHSRSGDRLAGQEAGPTQ